MIVYKGVEVSIDLLDLSDLVDLIEPVGKLVAVLGDAPVEVARQLVDFAEVEDVKN